MSWALRSEFSRLIHVEPHGLDSHQCRMAEVGCMERGMSESG